MADEEIKKSEETEEIEEIEETDGVKISDISKEKPLSLQSLCISLSMPNKMIEAICFLLQKLAAFKIRGSFPSGRTMVLFKVFAFSIKLKRKAAGDMVYPEKLLLKD